MGVSKRGGGCKKKRRKKSLITRERAEKRQNKMSRQKKLKGENSFLNYAAYFALFMGKHKLRLKEKYPYAISYSVAAAVQSWRRFLLEARKGKGRGTLHLLNDPFFLFSTPSSYFLGGT